MIPFISLTRDSEELEEIRSEVSSVLNSGKFILSEKLVEAEKSVSGLTGMRNAVGTANGTESIYLILKRAGAKRVGLCASSPLPCAQAVHMAGAEIVMYDCEKNSGLIDIEKLRDDRREADVMLAVHLYGQAERRAEISEICKERGMLLIEDISQAICTRDSSGHVGSSGAASALSFYPTKNLGCLGDGGMILTDDDEAAEEFRYMRNYGQKGIYSAEEFGINSRLDEIQAAVLLVKMKRLLRKSERRREIIRKYMSRIRNEGVALPGPRYAETSNGHIFPLFCSRRNSLKEHLAAWGIESAVHYPVPLHMQRAFLRDERYPNSELLAETELSIPVFPELSDEEVEEIINAVNGADFGQ